MKKYFNTKDKKNPGIHRDSSFLIQPLNYASTSSSMLTVFEALNFS